MGCKNKNRNFNGEKGKVGRKRWERRERIDLFILFVNIICIIRNWDIR